MLHLFRTFTAFTSDESGGIGILAICWFAALAAVAGVSVDAANGYRYKAILQATADAAVLAAVIDLPDADAARATALAYVEANMPPEMHGLVLDEGDAFIGRWNEETRTIEAAEMPDAVQVTVRRSRENANPVGATILHMIGFRSWDVVASAVAVRFYPGCLSREGLISAKRVRMTTDTHFVKDFCIHGAEGVSVQNHNSFEDGVKVTMEDLADFTMPTDGFSSNTGLEQALGVDFYDLTILDLVDEIVVELKDPLSRYQPSYIDPDLPAATEYRSGTSIRTYGLAPNQVHYLPCNGGNNVLNLPGDVVYSDVVIVTDCRISIGSKAQFHDVTIATTWDDADAAAVVSASSQVEWGADDNCAPGGGVRVIAPGAIDVAAQNYYYGGQFISLAEVSVAANVDGGTGVSVVSAQDISLTSSHGYMGLCRGIDMEADTYRVTYYRLVG